MKIVNNYRTFLSLLSRSMIPHYSIRFALYEEMFCARSNRNYFVRFLISVKRYKKKVSYKREFNLYLFAARNLGLQKTILSAVRLNILCLEMPWWVRFSSEWRIFTFIKYRYVTLSYFLFHRSVKHTKNFIGSNFPSFSRGTNLIYRIKIENVYSNF